MIKERYNKYLNVLKSELIPAMGCTEPIALAYLASYTRDLLKGVPDEIEVMVSGNILKNVKSVVVPNTKGMKGIEAAIAAGVIAGNKDKVLEVIEDVKDEDIDKIKDYLDSHIINVGISDSPYIFDIIMVFKKGHDIAYTRIVNSHTNIVHASVNDEVLIDKEIVNEDSHTEISMSVEEIFEFVNEVRIEDIKDMLDKQISCNMNIAEKGLNGDYGANIGKVLLKTYGDDIKIRAKAYAAAASDARMNGCDLPVIIVSGSGNQGITASLPVVVWSNGIGASMEDLYRALALSDLVTIHLKSGIGRLSAFCGATSAGVGAGAGIAYLETHDLITICHTIVNALAIVSGMVCDGAKASCAAKIQTAVDAGILGYYMYVNHQEFKDGDGLVLKGVENTISNISRLAKDGMKETDKEIIKMMIKKAK